jgi:ketosteroid isomerase-like protein
VSQENVEIVRAVYGRSDLELLHPDIEWHTRADLPDSGVHRGHDGVAAHTSQWTAAFNDFEIDVGEQIDAGDVVVSVVCLRGRLRGSDQAVEMQVVHVSRVQDGLVIEVHEYRTKDEALKAAGLEQ